MDLFSRRAGGHTATSEWVMRRRIRSMARRGYAVHSATVRRGGGVLGRFGRKSRCIVIYRKSPGQ